MCLCRELCVKYRHAFLERTFQLITGLLEESDAPVKREEGRRGENENTKRKESRGKGCKNVYIFFLIHEYFI